MFWIWIAIALCVLFLILLLRSMFDEVMARIEALEAKHESASSAK